MRALLRQNNTNSHLYRDEAWKTTQEILRASLVPLCDTCGQVERLRRDPDNPELALDRDDIVERLQFAITLIGQANQRLVYARIVNALSGMQGYTNRPTAEDHVKGRIAKLS